MFCDHIDYDDYFEKCNDCGKTNVEIHITKCIYDPSGVTPDDDGRCDKCGTKIEYIHHGFRLYWDGKRWYVQDNDKFNYTYTIAKTFEAAIAYTDTLVAI